MNTGILTISDLLRAGGARGESVRARPGGRAHLYAGRVGDSRPACGTRTRRLYPLAGRRPRACRRCVALLVRAGWVRPAAVSRVDLRDEWSDLTPTDLWLSYLMCETRAEADACRWLAGLLHDQLDVQPAADPAGRVRSLAEHRAGLLRYRTDLAELDRRALTVAEDEAELDELLAEQDAKERREHERRRRRALQRAC